jgi:hypothetical protein
MDGEVLSIEVRDRSTLEVGVDVVVLGSPVDKTGIKGKT